MQIVSTEASPSPVNSFIHFVAGLGGMASACALLLWQPEALATRWHPVTLAAVHLFALGGLMPVMLGALAQFLPVACGVALPPPGKRDAVLLGVLMTGAAVLGAGFVLGNAGMLVAGGGLGLLSVSVSLARVLRALWRQPALTALPAAMRRSALALLVTLVLAGLLLGILAGIDLPLPFLRLVDLHAQWGLIGWVGGLILTVAAVVVPMFHVSPAYPARWEQAVRSLPWLLLTLGCASLVGLNGLRSLAGGILAMLGVSFGVLTLRRVLASKRGERDAFWAGWLAIGFVAILLGALGGLAMSSADPRWGVAFGLCALVGLGGLSVTVMLYRIVPFLVWLHWQRANKARIRLPLLHQIIPSRAQTLQLCVEGAGLALLLGAPFAPALTACAAALLTAGKLFQSILIWRCLRDFRVQRNALLALPARVRPDR